MKNISSMAALAALLLVSCGQDTDVKFAGDEGAKVTFSASINEQNSQDVSRVTGVTWDDGDEVSISCGPTQKNVFYRYNAADNSFTAINRFDEIWLLGNEEYDVTAYYPHVGEEGTVPPVQIVEITSENQDTPEERAAFDFLYASTKATKAEPNVHLNFNHAMSRVNLEFVPGTDPEGNPVTLTNINKSIIKVGGEEMTSVDNGALTGHYWLSTQRNDTFQWTHGMDGGAYNLICERGSRAGQFRMMLAF